MAMAKKRKAKSCNSDEQEIISARPDDAGPSHQSRPIEGMTEDPILQPHHKIFLSHSGVQKDFVEQLCEDLERERHFPFFDKRPSSLPKGERFAELIKKAARECQMAVVVVSEDYFMSKWPMIELHAFVQASLTSNPKLKILPLFYRLSVAEFRDETRQEEWFRVWETWASDERIKVDEWKDSLKVLQKYNGIECKHKSGEDVAYRRTILSEICKAISPDIQWDDSHVQGRSKLCEIIRQKISEGLVDVTRKFGMYGVAGIGKTTVCKSLCNELAREFEGRVCCVEFGRQGREEQLKQVLNDLTNTSAEVLQQLKEGEGKHILKQQKSWNKKTFLAIDNVHDDLESIQQAKMYLQAPFHEGSVVIVTSRSLTTLISLQLTEIQCFETPELTEEDAVNAFLYYAVGKDFVKNPVDEHAIRSCVKRCVFQKGDQKGYHFHPFTLKALGAQLGNKPSDWVENLRKVPDFNYRQDKQNPVFSILKPSFDNLQPADQDLIMYVGHYKPLNYSSGNETVQVDLMEWLCLVNNQSIQEIKNGLQRLKEKAWLEDVDISYGRISMPDLLNEFLVFESQGRVDRSIPFEKRRWVYANNVDFIDLEKAPGCRCWDQLTLVRIQDWCNIEPRIASLGEINWKYYSNLVVLKLVGLSDSRGVLNLKGLKCLRSLEVCGMHKLDRLEGMEGLKNLTYFRWCFDYEDKRNPAKDKCADVDTIVGQFPASLKVLQVHLGILLSPDVLARCTSLRKLELTRIRAENLDISNCKSLESLKLSRVKLLQTLKCCSLEQLQAVELSDNDDFHCLEVIGDSHALRSVDLSRCRALPRVPDLSHATSVVELILRDTGLVLQEEDILMLASVSHLKPSFRFNRLGSKMVRHCESKSAFDVVLQPHHKIFLSHSGVQKDFAEQLYEDLKRRRHVPFFDQCPSSLPKGESFAERIKKAAQQCEMAVVVVSEDYFTSKWPMIELHTLVQASLTSNPKLKILPLFYRLSVAEFCDGTRQEEWFRVWETWASEGIKVDEWKDSLKVLQKYNGIEYRHESGVVAYRRTILSEICKAIPLDIQWDDSHVQRRSKLCEIIRQKISEGLVDVTRKFGMYGVAGIGKTTVCKSLCNELAREFEGRVCCVEFGRQGREEQLKQVLNDLTNTSAEVLQQLKEGEGKHILNQQISWTNKTFLAIDNVHDDSESIEQAKMYLEAPFHEGSVVIVTSRSLTTLISLQLTETQCFEFPELTVEDAVNWFLYGSTEEEVVRSCFNSRFFRKGDGKSFLYLPLALKALCSQFGSLGPKPLDWEKNLPAKIRDFNYRHEKENPVFIILRSSFDKLQPADQDLVMYVGLYMPRIYSSPPCSDVDILVDLMEWLCLVQKQSIEEIVVGLQRLKEKAWLEDVDISYGRISMPDLLNEFLVFESQGRVDRSIPFEKRRWVYANNVDFIDLEKAPGCRCWDQLTLVRIQDWCNIEPRIASLGEINWKYYSNLVVLKLVGLSDSRGVLNLKGLKCLRSLEVCGMHKLDRLEGMEGLKNLTYFRWCFDYEDKRNPAKDKCADVDTIVGQFPASLKVLQVHLGILLSPDVLARCTSLRKLELTRIRAENLDISNCKSLESLKLSRVKLLQTLKCCSLEQLQAVELSYINVFHCLEVIGDSPALRSVDLSGCRALSRLPDLSHATSVVELILGGTGIVLQEEDILMLASLPLLKPVLSASVTRIREDWVHEDKLNGIFSYGERLNGFVVGNCTQARDEYEVQYLVMFREVRLDFARKKVFTVDLGDIIRRMEDDLGRAPIEICSYQTFRPGPGPDTQPFGCRPARQTLVSFLRSLASHCLLSGAAVAQWCSRSS